MPTRVVLTAAALLAGAAGCGGSAPDQDADRTPPPSAATAEPTPAPETETEDATPALPGTRVRFEAADGRRVEGIYRRGQGPGRRPAVVLLHQSDGDASQWDTFAGELGRAGFTTVAVEGDGGLIIPDLGREARGAVRWLRGRPKVAARHIDVVGASVGADAAVWASATEPAGAIDRTVALSPSAELTLMDRYEAGRRGARDALLVSNREEAGGGKLLLETTTASRRLEVDGGHGVDLLTLPPVHDAVLDWLAEGVPALED